MLAASQVAVVTVVIAAVLGYAIGSLPTAGFLARLRGVDLRAAGSGNPGANNALRTSGPMLAASVLLVEAAKGYGAVWVGSLVSDDAGAVTAGIAAVAGNVFNVWYRFSGGKGLGISLGILAAAWPLVLAPVLAVTIGSVLLSRSAGIAALSAIAALVIMAVVWPDTGWPTGGVEPNGQLVVLSVGMGLVMVWKHHRDSPLNPKFRARTRESA
ncbi:MAG: glycerol-3-phosphate acyltransferase [Acidimicrobiia bacterium]|jgi:glycerol-3-phosphate acyltransferase PlsY